MKYYVSLGGILAAIAVSLVAWRQLNYSHHSHRIFVRNDSGDVIAIAQIALPPSKAVSFVLAWMPGRWKFAGKWRLESWKDEFPKRGTSAEDYRATRNGSSLRIDLNPPMADNNIVLIGKQVGPTYQGNWYHQIRGAGSSGSFEIIPISTPEALLVPRPEANLGRFTAEAQPIGQPDRLQAVLAGPLRAFGAPAAGYLQRWAS